MLNAYPITDGWLLDTELKCDLTYLSLVLDEYEAMRRAGSFRTKQWAVPEDSSQPVVPAYDSYEYQIACRPGSVVWGYLFTINPNATGTYSLQIRESCTGVPLASEVVSASAPGRENTQQYLFSKPLVIAGNGRLTVEICNQGSDFINQIQVILCGGEPYEELCSTNGGCK